MSERDGFRDKYQIIMMMCPDCPEMKVGPMSMKSKMMKCDGCGGTMKEMKAM